jgi:hypothetical protein
MRYYLEFGGRILEVGHISYMYLYNIFVTFKGSSGIESCGITWKSEEEFMKFGPSTILYNL